MALWTSISIFFAHPVVLALILALSLKLLVRSQHKSHSNNLTQHAKQAADLAISMWQGDMTKTDTGYNGTDHARFHHRRLAEGVVQQRAREFLALQSQRRSVRFFSTHAIPEGVLEDCIRTAGTAPSGAHCQPWRFCVVHSAETKLRIRELVEEHEQINCSGRMNPDSGFIAPFVRGLHTTTDISKPYLTAAPVLVIAMKEEYHLDPVSGARTENYHVEQSVGLAVGLLIAALTNVGLATLVSTPMGAERGIHSVLGLPDNETVFLLLPVGFPADTASVPDCDSRKPLDEIMVASP